MIKIINNKIVYQTTNRFCFGYFRLNIFHDIYDIYLPISDWLNRHYFVLEKDLFDSMFAIFVRYNQFNTLSYTFLYMCLYASTI